MVVACALGATACGSTPSENTGPAITVAQTTTTLSSDSPVPGESVDAGAASTDTTNAPGELAASAEQLSYAFEVFQGDRVTGELVLSGTSDPIAGVAYAEARNLLSGSGTTEIVNRDGEQFVRGITWTAELDEPQDPDVWYEIPKQDHVFLEPLGSVQNFEELRQRILSVSRVLDESEKSEGGMSLTFMLESQGAEEFDGTVLEPFASWAGEFVVRSDADGRVRELSLHRGSADAPSNTIVTYRFFDFGTSVFIPSISDPQPLDGAIILGPIGQISDDVDQPGTGTDPAAPVDPATLYDAESSEVIFRFWTVPSGDDDPFGVGSADINVVLLADGTVVRVDGTSVFDGKESYITWQLDEIGFVKLIDALTTNEIVAADEPFGLSSVAYKLTSDFASLEASAERGAASPEEQAQLRELTLLLYDQTWLSDHFLSEPEIWLPDLVSMTAVRTGFTTEPEWVWPLEASIPESGRAEDGAIVLCLEGRDGEDVYWHVTEGEDHSKMRFSDGEQSWFFTYHVWFPGYPVSDDPCR